MSYFKSLLLGIVVSIFFFVNSVFAQQLYGLHWKLAPLADVKEHPENVSRVNYVTQNWIDAVVPGTAFYAYVKAGKEPNPDYADNIYKVDHSKYNRPFIYRAEFVSDKQLPGKRLWLNLNGINKRGEVFVNGHHIGTMRGFMERGLYDVTALLNKSGKNAVAVVVTPPRNDPEHNHPLANWESPTYLSSGSWDWMPAVPGLNSGITDTVGFTTTGAVRILDPWIQAFLPDTSKADLKVNAQLENSTDKAVQGLVTVKIMPGNITITSKQQNVAPHSKLTVNLTAADFKQLKLNHPKLWWPNGYGGKANGTQHLYTCEVRFLQADGSVSDKVIKSFGIRKVTSDTTTLNGPMRVYINDVPILFKGGNWGMSDYMLKVRGKDYETRIKLHQAMNYNVIRNWTGEVTDEDFYKYCDKYGIMIWDDFWLNNFGAIDSLSVFKANAIEKVKRFRNHPSLVIWCGANEGVPGGEPNGAISQAIKEAITENDGTDKLYLPRSNAGVTNPNFSIHGGSKNLSGSGIWANVDLKTYFTDPHNGYLFSKNSYGMRSELGSATFVNIESFKKFMPAEYWHVPTEEEVNSKTNMWAKHYFSTDGALGGGSSPVNYIQSINKSYGSSKSIDEFCKKSQLLNLETLKAMYESWNDHMWNDATGMLIWMSQSAYPTMIWQTYDYYYDLTGAYFGSKQGCEPVHIQWNIANNAVKLINNRPFALQGLKAEAMVYDANGKLVSTFTQQKQLDVKATSATEVFVAFKDSINRSKLGDVYFLKLKLSDVKGKLLSSNFYWIGNKYLDYTSLNKLKPVGNRLHVSAVQVNSANDKVNKLLTYTVNNTSSDRVAFGIRAQLLNNQGKQILPAMINDSYFTLMPGEKKLLEVEVAPEQLTKGYKLDLTAYNQ
ncbi:sugar-binding domain-containing protein [Mucilaginibacter sp. CSA2-8R]|uniref:glycoside hydrolase family 2 protein n=1 Tax=Mucilaginibacter sp. CSA2-8R TaxID=3141542 RepID=UPI00315D066E